MISIGILKVRTSFTIDGFIQHLSNANESKQDSDYKDEKTHNKKRNKPTRHPSKNHNAVARLSTKKSKRTSRLKKRRIEK